MPHRPSLADFDKPLTKEEVEELRGRASKLASYEVKKEYQRVYELCRMDADRLPAARSIQELVTIWQALWDKARKRKTTRG